MEESDPVEAERREAFTEYLDENGVIDKLVDVLNRLFHEDDWPDKPLLYIRRYLGAEDGENIEALREENDELRFKNEQLETTVDALMNQLEGFERGNDN
jgi:hypothetical protein